MLLQCSGDGEHGHGVAVLGKMALFVSHFKISLPRHCSSTSFFFSD